MFRLFECCALSFFERFVLSFSLKIERFVSDSAEIWICGLYMTAYPKEQVKEFLLYHIVKGKYTFTNLPAEPTWFETVATADTAKINMYLLKDRNPNIVFNNFDGHYKSSIKPRTSNLYNADGSYMHVMDSWLDRPTKEQLNMK